MYTYLIRASERIKISASRNPWARLAEFRKVDAGASLLAQASESKCSLPSIKHRFSHLHLGDGWYRDAPEIADYLTTIQKMPVNSSRGISQNSGGEGYMAAFSQPSSLPIGRKQLGMGIRK